jgi:hypothetical protein
MFLKDDKYTCGEIEGLGSLGKDIVGPRSIQFRDKKYCLELARFLKPIEKSVYSMLNSNRVRCMAKGQNLTERARDLVTAYESFRDPVIILADHSKFDSHVTQDHLSAEFEFYEKLFGGKRWQRKYLRYLLAMQYNNKGRTKNGTRYVTPNTRMSGDMNTGLGNSVINLGMLRLWAGDDSFIYVDGDDSVLMMERESYNRLPELATYMLGLGMETKYEVVTQLQDLDFCQCKLVEVAGEWRLVREPLRMIMRDAFTPKYYTKAARKTLVRSMGYCELAICRGVPIGQALGLRYLEIAGKGKILKELDMYYQARQEMTDITKARAQPISLATRMSYETAFGITIWDQLRIEKEISKLDLADTGVQDYIKYITDVRHAGTCEDSNRSA